MARSKTSTSEAGSHGFSALPLAGNAVVAPQMKQFWKAQEKILSETEAFARHWFARRHEAAQEALKACEAAAEANPADAAGTVQVFRDWQAKSAERMASDMREWVDLWARCAGHLVSGEVGAGAAALDELRRQSTELHPHHATPV